jgi:hypothetical protein
MPTAVNSELSFHLLKFFIETIDFYTYFFLIYTICESNSPEYGRNGERKRF